MKKAFRSLRAAALALAFVLCIVPAAPARAEGGALTGTVSPNASVLLFAPCGDTELFAYTDGGTTRVSAADGSRSTATEYPGQYAFLRGGAVTIASSLDDFFAIQRFDADTLDETDFFPLEIRADDLYALETDGFGRLYAVLFSEPNEIFVYDAAGSYTGSLLFAEPVLGMQVLGETLYVFLETQGERIALDAGFPQAGADLFSYAADRPYRVFDAETYIDIEGRLCAMDGAVLFETGINPTDIHILADLIQTAKRDNFHFFCQIGSLLFY